MVGVTNGERVNIPQFVCFNSNNRCIPMHVDLRFRFESEWIEDTKILIISSGGYPRSAKVFTDAPPPPPRRPSRANVGDCKGGGG